MLIMRLLNWLGGYKRVSVPAEDSGPLLNILFQNRFDYWDVKREVGGELKLSLLNGEYKKLLSIAEHPERIRAEREYGLPQLIRRYRKRVGIPVGLFLMLFLMKISTEYIWDIDVSGNDKISDGEIIAALDELGCSVGTHIPTVDFYNICHEFILENEGISWISVNMTGTTASVRVIERSEKGELDNGGNGSPSNLIAERDGIIVRTETADGKTEVKPGDVVKAGQLLVSGTLDVGRDDGGRFVLVRSRGKVFAQTLRSFTVEVPLKETQKVEVKRKTGYKYLSFFGKKIKLQENSSILPSSCDIIEQRRIILFENGRLTGGIALPISVINGYACEYEEITAELSLDEAISEAKQRMSRVISYELEGAEIFSKSENYYVEERDECDVLILTLYVVSVENIAKEVPIGIVG